MGKIRCLCRAKLPPTSSEICVTEVKIELTLAICIAICAIYLETR